MRLSRQSTCWALSARPAALSGFVVAAAPLNQNTLVLGGLAAVAILGVGALGSQQQAGGEAVPAAAAAGAAGAVASPEKDAETRKREAQAVG